MITDKRTFINFISSLAQYPDPIDTETKLMAINGVMQGHGVTWRHLNIVLIEAVRSPDYADLKAELSPFLTIKAYFIYQVNTGAFGRFSRYDDIEAICSRCMDFTLMEAGNRVNMAENNPY